MAGCVGAQAHQELEVENANSCGCTPNKAMEANAIKDLIEKTLGPVEKREAIMYLVEEHMLSERCACDAVGLSRSANYPCRKSIQETSQRRMEMDKRIFITVAALFFGTASAQNCENVIELSKIRNTVVQSESAVQQHASNFCKEYAKSLSSRKSSSFGASYKFLSATFGSSGASMEEVASKYCDSDNLYVASKDAYRQYIESISPGAYGAYQQCIKMSQQDIRFNVDAGSILPTEFSVSVAFVSSSAYQKSAVLTYSSSDDVHCAWDDTTENTKVLPTGSTALLKCKRPDQGKKSYVTIVHSSSGTSLPLTLPWQAYDDHGIPMNALNELKQKINSLGTKIYDLGNGISRNSKRIQAISTSPTVTIYKCPKGTNGWNPGGAWASYGCQGQISSEAKCTNIEFPHVQTRDCAKLGTIRLF